MAKMTKEEFKKIRQRFDYKRQNLDQEYRDYWRDIANYTMPRHGRFLESDFQPQQGGNKHQYIINGAATKAANVAVAGIVGGLIPHSLPWFKLGFYEPDLNQWGPAKEWLSDVEKRMYSIFSQSNFYSAAQSSFREQILFGTGPFQVREHDKKHIWCKTWTVGEYVLMANQYDQVDTGYRWFWMTARALALQFGKDALTDSTKKLLDSTPDVYVEVVNCILPREGHDPNKKDTVNMPFASIYWERKASTEHPPLGESGYRTNSVMYPRWDTIGEDPYGATCPGMENLGDIKMLQKLERDKLEAIEKVTRPPMMKAEGTGRLSLLPDAINSVPASQMDQMKPVYQISPEINAIAAEIQNVVLRIKEGFFNDLFLMMLQDKSMTATEVAQRHEDKLKILGPVIEKQNSEFLAPLIDRVYDIMESKGLIPPPPPELEGQEIKVDYISLLAQAQRMVGTQGIEQVVGFVGSVAQLKPDVLDKVDFDKVIEHYAEARGTSPDLINPQEEVDATREQRAQLQQAAIAQEAAAQGADTAKTLSETQTEGGNALDNVLDQVIQ